MGNYAFLVASLVLFVRASSGLVSPSSFRIASCGTSHISRGVQRRSLLRDASAKKRFGASQVPRSEDSTRIAPVSSCSGGVRPLKNVPLEDVLEVEFDEMELELDLAKPKDEDAPPARAIALTDAASIIAGTAIGGGFLVLPSITTPIGYWPTCVGLIAAWTFLLLSSCAFVESAGLVALIQRRNAAAARSERGEGSGPKEEEEEGATSVATVIRFAFGKKAALVGGVGFIMQMLAVVTAQVVKGAELIAHLTGLPYALGCLIPPAFLGIFAFASKPEIVERTNTGLTAMMVGGFIALIAGTVVSGGAGRGAASTASLFARADWMRLLPNMQSAWAMPVFINLLCFGQAMPLIVERMVESAVSAQDGSEDKEQNEESTDPVTRSSQDSLRESALIRSRSAAFLGSVVPLVLCLSWAAVATALVSPTSPNPLFSLLARGPAISLPVILLSLGAIGTTLFGSFLAMGHFASDVVCMKLGYCSPTWMAACNAATVAMPCVLACLGPSLYLPLLAFAGAYPTTILHGLAPSLAALVLRRRITKTSTVDGLEDADAQLMAPHIVPGGKSTLVGLATTSIGLVGASTGLAVRHLLRAAG